MEQEEEKEIVASEEEETSSEEAVVNRVSSEELSSLITNRDRKGLRAVFETVPDIDIAEACEELEIEQLIFLFREAESSVTAPLFDELSQTKKEELVSAMTNKELVKLVNSQEPDDLTDTVGDMPANLASKVLAAADKDTREDINKLLKYKDDSAGAIMTTQFLEFKESSSVKQTIDTIRKKGKEAETVYTIFVRNDKRKFVGTVALDDLIWSDDDQKLSDIMDRSAPYCYVNTDKEEVANTIRRYDLNAVAIVNDDECLIGIVTVDDAVDVVVQEANEDIEKMHAVSALEDSYLETSSVSMAKKCVPWIIILIILGTFSSMVLSIFQDQIALLPILSAFLPVLMDTGGNAGGQTIALMIRGLALREFTPKDFWKVVFKELKSALIISAFIAIFACLWFTIEQYTGIVHNSLTDVIIDGNEITPTIWNGLCWTPEFFLHAIKISAIVSGTLFITTIVSKLIAVMLPLGVAAIKKDPAVIAQPLLTTLVDVASLLIYFAIAELLVLQFMPH